MEKVSLQDIRKDYKLASLNKKDVLPDPFQQFEKWFNEVIESRVDEPNAMTLATASKDGKPSARIVLLKGFDERGFYFYTNYESRKALELAENPNAALVFFWKELERQVRMEGKVRKTASDMSDAYFHSRPEKSRIGAWASPQSRIIASRDFLDQEVKKVEERFKNMPVTRPSFWGGYVLQPEKVEFWQGRSSRLHDRIHYSLGEEGRWQIERLAP